MADFNFTQEAQFSVSDHQFNYLPENRIVVRDSNAIILFDCDLNEDAISIMGKIIDGQKYYCFGMVEFTGASFSKEISVDETKSQVEFIPICLDILGSDDLRDVRIVQHVYHLENIPIYLESDGTCLTIVCPGSEDDPWYEFN